ncbi:MAG: 1-(5-phosphoribosyl)-5-[(5-phosphoribosylamino)methylideneamino] imidazole-4-carboxamide isomerase [Anaerolineales bacterium]|nr:1-(5-phosphoribosyl)-5-[(5-phosphoribosylamino)methylideneamino] imidazole-4-carboxamide isomerase [Anaerolineales bacterium]
MIVFPAIDLRQGRCVRLYQGDPEQEVVFGRNPVAIAEQWVDQGAEWLHVVNLDGAFGEASDNLGVVETIASTVDAQIQFGGGLRSLADMAQMLERGVARVIVGTMAITAPETVAQAVDQFGAERLIVGIDARDGRVATHGWRETSDTDVMDLAEQIMALGVNRVVYTDIARDGTMRGPDVAGTRRLAAETGLNVIASGGVASLNDVKALRAHEHAGIEGVIIGQALYTGAIDLGEAIEVAETE